ncbi:MAG: polysaccharide deacetylase family protein [Clostridiales bacterium]|nr:polysaccharide deacetylase family protein [Clostridiales bacterium]
MKKKRKISVKLPLLAVLLLALCLSVSAAAESSSSSASQESETEAPADGLVTVNGKSLYYKNGQKYTGMAQIGEDWYYFSKGVMKKSYWYTSAKGNKYYFRKTGVRAASVRLKINDSYYYFASNGKMVTSKRVKINDNYYYFNSKGVMVSGKRVKINDNYYYFNSSGNILTSMLFKFNGNYYYLISKGVMVSGKRVKINDSYYYFASSGKMVTSKKVKINDYYYYFNSNGKMVTGLKKIDGSYYYFKSNGRMATGLVKIDGSYYYFSSNGKRKTGWLTDESGNKYYFDKTTGERVTGKQIISHYIRYFDEKGVLYRSVDMDGKMVALTYDDGPSKNTTTILNTLKKYNSVATFFVVGSRVSTFSSTVKAAFDMGCEIGNHTWDHSTLTRLSATSVKSQLTRTNSAVKAITGVSPVIMRAPGGSSNSTVSSVAGMPIIYWSIDTRDWATHSSSQTISAVLNHIQDGDIVLMHDLYSWTASASQTIIPSLVSRGYQLVTVSELAECRGGMTNGTVYKSFR